MRKKLSGCVVMLAAATPRVAHKTLALCLEVQPYIDKQRYALPQRARVLE